jgi:TatD DNase family protein
MWTDTHAHLDYESFGQEQPDIIYRANRKEVTAIITIGIDLPSSRKSVRLAETYHGVYAGIGIHPNDASAFDDRAGNELRELAQHPKVVAFGETGLDYYWKETPAEVQRTAFMKTIELAAEFGKPIIVHNRDAHDDVVAVLRESKNRYPQLEGVMHCFSGDRRYLDEINQLGFYVSVAGNVTYKKSNLPELLPFIPQDRLLIETDAPFLSPVPFRGKRNEPAHIPLIADKMAACLSMDIEKLSRITSGNAGRLFRLNPMAVTQEPVNLNNNMKN